MAQAQLAEAETHLAETLISAPISGIVSLLVARQGEVIRAGDPILVLVDLDDIWVKTEVEETYVTRLSIGLPMTAVLPDGERIEGKISFIAPEAEFATQRDVDLVKRDVRTFGIRVAVPNPERRLHAGMTAYVLFDKTALPERGPR